MSGGGGITIGVDIGTTSVKAVAVDEAGTVVDHARIPHPVLSSAPGRFEHDVTRAWRRGPRQAVARLGHLSPAAVAVTTMVPSMVALTARHRPLGPGLLYGDDRGRLDGETEEPLGFLRWLARTHRDAARYWPAAAVANHALSGEGVADIATCFTMGPLLGNGGWSPEVCASVGARPDQLPAIGGSGDVIGRVTGTDVVLASGSVDGYCEQLVAGATEPGDVLVLCGTTLLTWVVTDEPVEVPGLWTHPHPQRGRWVVGGASNAGGLFQDWLHRLLASSRPSKGSQPERLGSPKPRPARPGSLGLCAPGDVPVAVPYIRGERTPFHDPSKRASIHGLHLGHGAAELQRAGWEAAGFVAKHHIDLVGRPVHRVVAAGGGTQSPGWMQALADATQLPVHVAADPLGAARGAAYLARMAIDDEARIAGAAAWARTGHVVDPDPAWVDPVAERYERFRAEGDHPR